MKVIILAAGRGSRLGERTKDRPKCMVEICGKTILERCISSLEEAGIHRDDIAIVTGYRKDLIRVSGVHYFHNKNWEQTNMFLSMMEAKEWLKAEPCLVCYSDVIFSAHAIKSLAASDAPLAVTYYTGFWELWQMRMEDPLSDLETFKIDSQNMLLEIGKKPHAKEDKICSDSFYDVVSSISFAQRMVKEIIKEITKKSKWVQCTEKSIAFFSTHPNEKDSGLCAAHCLFGSSL